MTLSLLTLTRPLLYHHTLARSPLYDTSTGTHVHTSQHATHIHTECVLSVERTRSVHIQNRNRMCSLHLREHTSQHVTHIRPESQANSIPFISYIYTYNSWSDSPCCACRYVHTSLSLSLSHTHTHTCAYI